MEKSNRISNSDFLVGGTCYFKEELLPSKKEIVLELCDRINSIAKCKYFFDKSDANKKTKKQKFSRSIMASELDFAIEEKHKYLFLDGPFVTTGKDKERSMEASVELFNYWKTSKILYFDFTMCFPHISEPAGDFFKWVVSLLKSHYGFIYINKYRQYMAAELNAIPSSFWKDTTEETEQWEEEIGFYRRNDENYDEYVRKAYWGNCLNAIHVKKLGGFDTVKKEAPAYLVEKMPDGRAYIQLTESPYNYNETGYKGKLKELDKYFSPIILPGRPEVNWDYYDVKRL